MQSGLRHNRVGLGGGTAAGLQGWQPATAASDSSLAFALRSFFLSLRVALQPEPELEAALLAELLLPAEAERAAGLAARAGLLSFLRTPRVPGLLDGERPRPFLLLSV